MRQTQEHEIVTERHYMESSQKVNRNNNDAFKGYVGNITSVVFGVALSSLANIWESENQQSTIANLSDQFNSSIYNAQVTKDQWCDALDLANRKLRIHVENGTRSDKPASVFFMDKTDCVKILRSPLPS